MRIAALPVIIGLLAPSVAAAQKPANPAPQSKPAPAKPAASSAELQGPALAYYEFLLARHLEGQDDEEGALAALKRALAADPKSAEIRAELASFYARQNKAAEAIENAEAALKIDPDSSEAHRILGLVYAARSEGALPPPAGRTPTQLRSEAIAHLSKIIDSPAVATDLSLQVTLGRLHMRNGEPAKAIPILEGVVSQAPFATEPYTLLADARLAVGKPNEAAEALAMAAELDPRRYSNLAELYERLGRWPEAAEAYGNAVESLRSPTRDLRLRYVAALLNVPEAAARQRARDVLKELLATSPNDTRALYLLASANRQLRDFPAAEDAARKMLTIDPTSVTGLYALSQVFAAQGDAKKIIELVSPFAKDVATRAKGNEGDAALLMSQLGLAHLQLGDAQSAIAAFATAKSLSPKNPAFDAYVVQAHLSAKEYQKAADLAADALTRFAGHTVLTGLRADALAELGRRDEAVKLLQDARAADPDDEALTLKLGAIFEESGRVEDAEREFRRLIERDPMNATALNYLGYMLADRGVRLSEAITLIERALKVEPDNPAFLDSLGWAYFKNGQLVEAEAPLRRAADVLTSESVIQDHFGDVLAKRGKTEEAVAAWQRALTGDMQGVDKATIEKKIRDARVRRK